MPEGWRGPCPCCSEGWEGKGSGVSSATQWVWAAVVVACPPPVFAWRGSSSCWFGLCLAPASARTPFHPQCSGWGGTAPHAEHPLPWDLVPSVILMSPCPCLWIYVYVYRQKYWKCILGTPDMSGPQRRRKM